MPIELEKYVDNLYRFALSLTSDRHQAEDLTQECLLRAHSSSKQLRTKESTKSWLFQIMVNLWKDRHKKKRLETADINDVELRDHQLQPEQRAEQSETTNSILLMMDQLPRQQRNILHLSAVEHLTNSEISKLLAVSENSVKANLSIARKTMRQHLNAFNQQLSD